MASVDEAVLAFCSGNGAFAFDECQVFIVKDHKAETASIDAETTVAWLKQITCVSNQWVFDTCAVAQCETDSFVTYVSLLWLQPKWKVINVVYTEKLHAKPVLPLDMMGAISCCWDDYVTANRYCDGMAMSKVFHPVCRLTFMNDNELRIINQGEFCGMVSNRYETELHRPYKEWKGTEEACLGSTLLGVDLAAPNLAVVRLKVGHPPKLWSDLLVCARFNGKWWILHKSSDSEPLIPDRSV